MTSRLDIIKNLCGGVVADSPYGLSEVWEYRSLTSKPSADPRTYSPWMSVSGLASQGKESEVFDEMKHSYKKYINSSFRIQDGAADLRIGDQVRDPKEVVWNVVGILSSGPGTVAYSIGREIGTIAGPDRKGAL